MPVKRTVLGQAVTREKVRRAKELRAAMTPAEAAPWKLLRTRILGGFHFRRQQVIDRCIVDFYCHACALVIEVDGDVHDLQQEHDAQRDLHLMDRGFRVLRFSNEEALSGLHVVKN